MLDHPAKLRALAAMVNADIKSSSWWCLLDTRLPGIHKQITISSVSDKEFDKSE